MTASIAPVFTVFYQGAVAPTASVYVYTTGTTTPLTTYSDAALTVPNTNPIIADANGQVVFYIPTTTAIRLDLYTSGGIASGTFIKTLDPVYPVAVAGGGGSASEASLPSATTTDLGSTGSNLVKVTGTTTITSFGTSAVTTNPLYYVRFTGALTITYNASSMILPNATSITTTANSAGLFEYLGSGNWQCLLYQGTLSAGRVVTVTEVTDATDISLSQVATQTNVGSTASITIPTKGIINLYFTGELITATTGQGLILGLRIGSTNYWPSSTRVGTTVYANTVYADSVGTWVIKGFGLLLDDGTATLNITFGNNCVGIGIEASGIPTGAQTVQVVAAKTNASGTMTLKGTVVTTRVCITVEDHT